jgi:hypothetical protein
LMLQMLWLVFTIYFHKLFSTLSENPLSFTTISPYPSLPLTLSRSL